MKRLVIICLTLLVCNCAIGQIITMRTITKVEPAPIIAPQYTQSQPQQSKPKADKGYGQFVNLSYGYNKVTDYVGVHYIGGYRFNSYLFLGLGAGVNFSLFTSNATSLPLPYCKPSTINIPVYLNFKANFTKSAWSPFVSLSVGGRISPVNGEMVDMVSISYNQSGLLGSACFGVDRKLTDRLSFYLGLGYQVESFMYVYANRNSLDLEHGHTLFHGFNINLGVSF